MASRTGEKGDSICVEDLPIQVTRRPFKISSYISSRFLESGDLTVCGGLFIDMPRMHNECGCVTDSTVVTQFNKTRISEIIPSGRLIGERCVIGVR